MKKLSVLTGIKNGKEVRILIFIAIIGLVAIGAPGYSEITHIVEGRAAADVVVIDAGHGGMDGGAESWEGVPEKDINLAIAKEIKGLAEKDGWRVVMTRNKDENLSEDKGSIRSRKSQDLRQRKQIIDKIQPTLTVSIHLNSFKEDKSVHGAQVFFPEGGEKSKLLAEMIQEEIKIGINDGTERVPLVKRDVLIFKNPKTPIVIVECGFLSNQGEAKRLQEENYQKKMALCIYKGIMKYTQKEPVKTVIVEDSRDIDKG